MNLRGVGITPQVAALTRAQTSPRPPTMAQPSPDSAQLSRPAALYSKLESLSRSDPSRFAEAADAIAKTLGEAASDATNSFQKELLSDLASKFTEAAKTGEASGLEPPPGPPPGGGGGGPPRGSANGEAYRRVMDDASRAQMESLLSSIASIVENVSTR